MSQRSQRSKPQLKKVNLTIGIEDNDADGAPKRQEETKDVKEILAPQLELNLPKKSQENQKLGGKQVALNISAPVETFVAKSRPKPTLQLGTSSKEPTKDAIKIHEIAVKPV